MTPERVFQVLTVTGMLAGGWFYGEYWKNSGKFGDGTGSAELRAQNTELALKNDGLRDQLAQARSMLQNGPYPVPDDLIAWVEKDYGMVFLRPPNVRLASPASMRDVAENNLRLVHGENGLETENIAWELIGLIPPVQHLQGQWIMLETVGTKGIFDLGKEQILLSETFDPDAVPDTSVLIRLLARQLTFQNHPRKEWRSRDEWEAWQGVHIGAAATSQARYLLRQSAVDDAEPPDPESEREELLLRLPPAIQGFANFPFVEGNDYARSFYIDSRKAWAGMFQSPATTTSAIIHPGQAPETSETVSLPVAVDSLLGENCLGELGLRLWMEPFLGMEISAELAEEWRDDRYQLTGRGEDVFLIWKIRLANEEAATRFAKEIDFSMMAHLRETQPTREIRMSAEGGEVTFTSRPESP